MVIRCRAAILWKPAGPFSIEKVEVAPPKAKEVHIKFIMATGLCGTEMKMLKDKTLHHHHYPIMVGHEGAGIVESVGEGVSTVKTGMNWHLCYCILYTKKKCYMNPRIKCEK
uniref:Alcohol dehydrogenase-like N-terminal domain-containing protein n=1 Tax=Balaenoptera musculus TaxID=9771 RepID=A0A8C0C918_BALMU